jgi:hypothetical protein
MAKLIWHIDRAKFAFDDAAEYDSWKEEQKVRFEWSPSSADSAGENLFEEAYDIEMDFEITKPDSELKVTLEDDGPVVSAWVAVEVQTTGDFDDEAFEEWASEEGGWASASIYLSDVDATITEDDGGDWRLAKG